MKIRCEYDAIVLTNLYEQKGFKSRPHLTRSALSNEYLFDIMIYVIYIY